MFRPLLRASFLALLLAPVHAAGAAAPPLPREALPSRPLPPEFTNQYSGLVTGDLCLIKATPADPYQPSTIAKCYRWNKGPQAWQQIANPLPFTTWPASCRNGMLEFIVPSTEGGMPTRSIVEAASGVEIWSELPVWDFAVSDAYYAGFGSGEIQVHSRLGATETIQVQTAPYAHDWKLNGSELAWVTHSNGQDTVTWRNLATGQTGSWTYQGGFTKLAGVFNGKVLVHRGGSSPLLLLPGQPAGVPVAMPPAYVPGVKPLGGSLDSNGGILSMTPEGAWIRGMFSNPAQGNLPIALHFNLMSSDTVSCDRVATGAEINGLDGSQVLVFPTWNGAPELVDGASTARPVISLGEGRGTEVSGVIEVPVRLDRPSVEQIRVRVRTRSGGSAATSDYMAKDEQVVINPGQLEGTFLITVNQDTVAERHETISLEVVEATGAIVTPDSSGFAVIEASGVSRFYVAAPPLLVTWPVMEPTDLVGGDGLRYRIVLPGAAVPMVEVSEPATGVVLETIAMTGRRPGVGSMFYPFLSATADGVRFQFQENYHHQAWDLSGSRSAPGVALKVNPPAEGGMAGHLEFSLMEPSSAPVNVSWQWSVLPKANGFPGSTSEPSFEPTGSIVVPADGSMVAKPVWLRSLDGTDLATSMRVELSNAAGQVIELALVDPTPGAFAPQGGTVLSPAVSSGSLKVIGGKLYVGGHGPADSQGAYRGSVEVFDPVTGAHLNTILPPSTLTHRGFGNSIDGDETDLFITAVEYPSLPKTTPKILAKYRTVLVYSQATGQLRATLTSPYAGFGDMIRFSDDYLAVCARSSFDPTIKGSNTPGGVLLYRRSDYKLAGQVKMVGNQIGTSMELSEDTLYLGFPGMTHLYRYPRGRGKDLWEYVGGVYVFKLPNLKKAQLLTSPTGMKHGAGFGLYMNLEPSGDLLVTEGSTTHRIDPSGQRPPSIESMPGDFFPVMGFSEADGLRMTTHPQLYDLATRTPLVELETYSGGVIGGGAVFLQTISSSSGLRRLPLQHCGNFDLWTRFGGAESAGVADPSGDGNGNGKPDIEDYIIAQVGALPTVEMAEDIYPYVHQRLRRVKLKANGELPPDATMLVEYRHADGPWKLGAVKRGKGPLRLVEGGAQGVDGWTPLLKPTFAVDYLEFRASFMHSQATALGQDEFRVLVD